METAEYSATDALGQVVLPEKSTLARRNAALRGTSDSSTMSAFPADNPSARGQCFASEQQS